MNNTQRGIICYHYKQYLQNMINKDRIGGFEDIECMFESLADSDDKLKEVMDEIYKRLDKEQIC